MASMELDEGITKIENLAIDESVFCSASVITLVQKVIAEAIGTFFVVFAGCGSVVVNKMYGEVTFPGICITWGLIVMVMVYSVGHISGAHFNPAVTITFTIFRRFPFKQLPLYIGAQFLGAILASGTLYLLFNPKAEHFFGTTPVGTSLQSFVIEIITTFLLMFVISGVATDTRARWTGSTEMGISLLGTVSSIFTRCSKKVSNAARKLRPGNQSKATLSRRPSVRLAISSKNKAIHRKRGSSRNLKQRLAAEDKEEEEKEIEEGEEDGLWQRTILMGEKCQPLDFSGVIYYDSKGRRSEIPTPRSPLRSPLPSFAAKVPVTVGG